MAAYLVEVSRWVKETEEKLTAYEPEVPTVKNYETTLTPASSVAANSSSSETFTLSGVTNGERLAVTGDPNTGVVFAKYAEATADDEISVTFQNVSASGLTPATGTYRFLSVIGVE
jgi:hypothetical protein